ncbi:putative uncharacterized protein [Janthinobacterium agaricidamnosum NBRC 102515 = DSM 9628]|uniref:Transmembrane protein n=1 Tax=Janthinobacterium agaricidamnosum NBRC 102515 = DSM 9628 TaxID=1349767 RepID=W0VAG4_9BURK|nr:putative uncharacterized protein [Janthinobacterium agaricidamnosum NBRC 102515 = DSM 9628]
MWAGAVLGLLLCGGAALAGCQVFEQRQQRLAAIERAAQRQAIQSQPKQAAKSAVQIPEAQAVFVNAAVLQLNLPWRDLQEAVAAATPPAVALLALEPDARKRVLKISAEARNSDDMIAYIQQLKEQELFSGVQLVRHEISQLDPNRPIRFQVEAGWSAP